MHTLDSWRSSGRGFTFEGQPVFYRREGTGPVLLAVHGYPLSSFDWHRIWEPLTARFDVIAPDFLGFGFSAKPRAYRYSVMAHADLALALLDALGVESYRVLTHDMGNSIGQELLARADPRLASICFLNGGLFPEVYRPRLIQRLLNSPLGGFIGPRVPRAAFRRALSEVFGPRTKPTDDELELYWRLVNFNEGLRVTHLVGRFAVERFTHRERWVGALTSAKVPMRFVDGPADPNSGLHMVQRYRELVRDPDVVLLDPEIGHWPQLEAPEATARAVLAHFAA
jgi:pimeloyl-ACP methyl ester carboxylesterase